MEKTVVPNVVPYEIEQEIRNAAECYSKAIASGEKVKAWLESIGEGEVNNLRDQWVLSVESGSNEPESVIEFFNGYLSNLTTKP